ncbi:MAG: hypothetical protein AAF603_08500 [Pseudomonadota bacterium]
MTKDAPPKPSEGPEKNKRLSKEERLAQALRHNLRRRKVAAKSQDKI